MPPPTIHQISFTLGQLGLYYKYSPQTDDWSQCPITPTDQDESITLNLLALLLVTTSSEGNVAVSFRKAGQSPPELLYSKHHPCTKEETAYIAKLFAIATDMDIASGVKHCNLFDLAIRYCKPKILSRLQKVYAFLTSRGAENNFGIRDLDQPYEGDTDEQQTQFQTAIRKFVATTVFPPGSPLPSFLKNWFHYLLQTLEPSSGFDYEARHYDIARIILVSHLLVANARSRRILDQQLLYRLGKLCEYHVAILRLLRWVESFNSDQLCRLKLTEVCTKLGSGWSYPYEILSDLVA